MIRPVIAVVALALLAGACNRPAQPARPAAPAVKIAARAGDYVIDPNHTTLFFRIQHIGLGQYVARFRKIDGRVVFDPDRVELSSVEATVDPASIGADLPMDWKTAAPNSPYIGWEDELANNPQFLNARAFPTITFRSTNIERTGPATAKITGDLTLLGQTRPLVLDAELTGSTDSYPMIGGSAFGVRATGSFKRSDFGWTAFQGQPGLGDLITFEFNGEFTPAKPAAA